MLKLYNTLTRKKEKFIPLNPPKVGMYTCGPTVYQKPHIGNWRTWVLGDLLLRTLDYLGYQVDYVINITDVGHLASDADTGEDKLAKAAQKERKTAWEVAEFYTKDFLKGFNELNLKEPKVFPKATDHIKEQIDLVKRIEQAGFTYRTTDGIYFDIQAYEKKGNRYGVLSPLDRIKEGARVEKNPEKKDPRDFALWKFSPRDQKRDMEWDSPWGKGFPGWHIECSAMSMRYLGEQFDLHLGGEDLISTHHPNEIAQSEAATGKKPFVRYWVHGAFLLVDGGKMSKSLGNVYTLDDIKKRGFEPLDLRYFYLTGHYRKQFNFTWEALKSAREARIRLWRLLADQSGKDGDRKTTLFEKEFIKAIEDDLNLPQALAVVWRVAREKALSGREKKRIIFDFDRILGLRLEELVKSREKIPEKIKKLVQERDQLRKEGNWQKADRIRKEIEKAGFFLKDGPEGTRVSRRLSLDEKRGNSV